MVYEEKLLSYIHKSLYTAPYMKTWHRQHSASLACPFLTLARVRSQKKQIQVECLRSLMCKDDANPCSVNEVLQKMQVNSLNLQIIPSKIDGIESPKKFVAATLIL